MELTGRAERVFSFLKRNHGGVTVREVSKAVNYDLSHIYRILKDLEKKDYVEHFYASTYHDRPVKVFKLKSVL